MSALPVQVERRSAPGEASDRALLADLQRGDERAFEELFARHYPGVYGVVLRVVGSPEEAEDLTQETFLKLYRRPLADTDDVNLRGWLYRVATNAGFNAVRARRRRFGWLQRVAGRADRQAADNPLDLVTARDEAETVRRHLATLPERQRSALVLRASGMSYAEVADVLGVSAASIGTILSRAERAFKASFEAGQRHTGGPG